MPKTGRLFEGSWVLHLSKIAVASFLVFASLQALSTLYGNTRSKKDVKSDVIEFWATGKLLRVHGNPYDIASILQLEGREGLEEDPAHYNFGPPVALPFWFPLGFMGIRAASVLWYGAQLLCLFAAMRLLGGLYGRGLGPVLWTVFLFAPVLFCERAGQLGIFLLLALLLFFTTLRQRPFLAGVCLAPLILKPHIFLPFACVLMVWILLERAWKVVLGFLIAAGFSIALSVWLDPKCWQQYREMMAHAGVINLPLPCLSAYLRRLLKAPPFVQFLPSAVASCLAIAVYLKKRRSWSWENDGVMLLALGLVVAPYSWVMDEVIAMPALVSRLVRCRYSWPSLGFLALFNTVAVLEGMKQVQVRSAGYLWTAPVWLLWCVVVDRMPSAAEQPVPTMPVE